MATKPIQLIYFDENKSSIDPIQEIVVNQQAINWLNQVNQDKHIAIVAVVGKYRTGKSYILNRVLLNQNNGFEVGPTINACTKGLWVWPDLIPHPTDPTMQFMVMDTEGLGSLQQGQEVDTKIFLIAMLLSSYFIYNSLTSIDEKAIQSLSLVVNLSKLLSKGNEKDRKNILNSFPSFMWLVRDFTLQMVDKNNKPIRPIDYLNNALQFQEGNSDLTIRKNSVRKQLINFFKDRDCFTLIRPVDDQRKLQNMAKLQDSELRPQFLEKIGQFRNKVLGNMKKKMFKGKPCSPAMFVELCQYFCTSINQGGLPEIQNNWDLVCKAESSRLEKRCLEEFGIFLKKNSEKKAETVDMKIFETEANEIVVRLLKNFQKNALGDKLQKKKALKETMIGEYQRLKKKISTSKNQALDQKLNSINEDMYSMINQNEINSIFEVCEKYDGVIEKESKGASDQTSHYLYKKCFEGLKTNCFTLFANLIQSNKNEKEALEQKLVSCIEAMNRMKEEQAQKLREAEAGYRQLSKQKVESELRAKEENQDLKRRLQKVQAKRNNENVNLCN